MSAPAVKIYSSSNCSYCMWAKKLLDKKQVAYQEIRIDMDEEERNKMVEVTGKTSVPQIFIGERHIGGYSEMVELDQDGELDKLLSAAD